MTVALPIEARLDAVQAALAECSRALLVAEPGAGKTTRVPLALLEASWCDGGKLLLLEPRRVAARLAAGFMAESLGETVGETVGYRMRGESRVGKTTRLEVVTQGVLTRMLQEDPLLEGVSGVIFDEFHERSLEADLGLALAL
ncbi:DEAD/DEAH box helicase, partial [Halomonas sp.]